MSGTKQEKEMKTKTKTQTGAAVFTQICTNGGDLFALDSTGRVWAHVQSNIGSHWWKQMTNVRLVEDDSADSDNQ